MALMIGGWAYAADIPVGPLRSAFGFEPAELVPDLAVSDVKGARATMRALGGKSGTVFVTRDLECPVSQRYMPRIVEMATRYRARGYNFVIIDTTPHDPPQARAAAAGLKGVRSVLDNRKALVTALRAVSTAEAFLIDARGTLRYRGAIDDQYGLSHQRAKATAHWLREALDKVVRGEEVPVPHTEAAGCALSTDAAAASAALPVTYHNRISRIVQAKCEVCHRIGGLGPMPLQNYRQVADRRAVIDVMVGSDRMPPWSAQKGIGHWANDRSLSARDKSDLLAWARNGAPEGNPADAPLPRRFPREWNIGKPDAIVDIPEAIRVPAQGVIAYKYVYAKTDFGEDKWINAVELRPTEPSVVHHVIALLEEPGSKTPQDTASGFFGITVPGSLGIVYPPGTGKRIPRGAWIKFEIHYQPNGTEKTDRTQIGFRFSSTPLREVLSRSAAYADFVIPPHNPRYEVQATHAISQDGLLLSLFPHMHLRGTAFRYELLRPNGEKVELLRVPKFDFNWQSYYELKEPLEVTAGSKLIATAWYDNSKANPWNPDPSKAVRWGAQTYEEMMIGYFDFLPASAK